MKAFVAVAAIVMCFGLSACAGVDTRAERARGQALGPEVDYAKVVAVNQWALRRGATLRWVQYPTLPREKDG